MFYCWIHCKKNSKIFQKIRKIVFCLKKKKGSQEGKFAPFFPAKSDTTFRWVLTCSDANFFYFFYKMPVFVLELKIQTMLEVLIVRAYIMKSLGVMFKKIFAKMPIRQSKCQNMNGVTLLALEMKVKTKWCNIFVFLWQENWHIFNFCRFGRICFHPVLNTYL